MYNTLPYLDFQQEVKSAFLESEIYKDLQEPWEKDAEFDYFICPSRDKADVDNNAKSFCDSVVRAGVLRDDSQIQKITGTKCQKCRNLHWKKRCRYSFFPKIGRAHV